MWAVKRERKKKRHRDERNWRKKSKAVFFFFFLFQCHSGTSHGEKIPSVLAVSDSSEFLDSLRRQVLLIGPGTSNTSLPTPTILRQGPL